MPLQWNNAYRTEHDEIDAQHQQLFTRINDFLDANDKDGLTVSGIELQKYTLDHFAFEEALMKRWRYPDIAEHSAQHGNLLSLLDDAIQDPVRQRFNRENLDAFLSDWVLNHIATADQRLAIHIAFSGG